MANPFSPAQVDFSMLAKLPLLYQQGQQYARENALRGINAFNPDGSVNYQAIWQYDPEEAIKAMTANSAVNGVYGTPIFTQDESGNLGISAIPKSGGSLVPLNSGGKRVLEPQHFVDQGTQVAPYGARSGQPTAAPIPIDVSGEKAAQAAGESKGAAAASIPDVLLNATNAVQSIDEAISAPGRETATGESSVFDPRNYIPGTEAYSYKAGNLEKVKGQAFLSSIQQMRGLGSLSDAEGRAASAAQSALNTGQTDSAHLQALKELKALTLRGVLRTYQKAGQDAPQEVIDAWSKAEQESNLGKKVPFKADTGATGPMTGRSLVSPMVSDVGGQIPGPAVPGAGVVTTNPQGSIFTGQQASPSPGVVDWRTYFGNQ